MNYLVIGNFCANRVDEYIIKRKERDSKKGYLIMLKVVWNISLAICLAKADDPSILVSQSHLKTGTILIYVRQNILKAIFRSCGSEN